MVSFRILRTDLGLDATTLCGERLLIGRAQTNDVVINDASVALSHAGICQREHKFWLTNFAAQATQLNGAAITHAELMPGDVMQIGVCALRVTARPDGLQIEVSAQAARVSENTRPAPPDETQDALDAFWHAQRAPAGLDETSTDAWPAAVFRGNELAPPAPRRLRPGWLRIALAVIALTAATALAFPRAFAPGVLSSAHQRAQFAHSPANAQRAAQGACLSCHGVTHAMQINCAACHTTANFQPALSAKHDKLKLQCVTCHAEHRGASYDAKLIDNALCTNCHQQKHGKPVAYPVNTRGVWSWDGISQTNWQQHQLPGQTADYTLREQFHMLHGEGRAQGRTRCTDCHLGGTAPATVKQQVRESCGQCHTLRPDFPAVAQPQNDATRCTACHSQHGTPRDDKASLRTDN